MTKVLSALLAALLVPLTLTPSYAGQAATPAAARATAAPPAVTGRVVTFNGGSVAGLTVRLRQWGRTGPSLVTATAKTNATGQFRLVGGQAGSSYYVELLKGTFQHGWAGGSQPRVFHRRVADSDLYKGGAHVGKVIATPAFVRGRLVDAVTKQPVRGVRVNFTPLAGPSTLTAVTARNGTFRIAGLKGDDFSMGFVGSDVGYEDGSWGCDGNVVSNELECQAPLGVITKNILIEKD